MRKLVILTWVLLLAPMALQAAKVKALLVNNDNKPVQNIDCKLVNKATSQETVLKANKKGEADFEKVMAGEYVLQAFMKGYIEATSDPISVTGTEKDLSVTLVVIEEKVYKGIEEQANLLLSQAKFKEASVLYKEMLKITPKEAVVW